MATSQTEDVKGRLRSASPPPAHGMKPRAGTAPASPGKHGEATALTGSGLAFKASVMDEKSKTPWSEFKFLTKDSWLSEALTREVYQLSMGHSIGPRASRRVHEAMQAVVCGTKRKVFIYSKIPVEFQGRASFLESLGFHLITTSVWFRKRVGRHVKPSSDPRVRRARLSDRIAVVRLAATCFRFSRFHIDPALHRALADRLKAQWVAGYFNGKRGDDLYVGLRGGKVGGFLLLAKGRQGESIMDLMAVDPKCRREGLASAMIACAESEAKPGSWLEVRTQLANIPSLILYEKIGFQIAGAEHVFHYHRFSRRGK